MPYKICYCDTPTCDTNSLVTQNGVMLYQVIFQTNLQLHSVGLLPLVSNLTAHLKATQMATSIAAVKETVSFSDFSHQLFWYNYER